MQTSVNVNIDRALDGYVNRSWAEPFVVLHDKSRGNTISFYIAGNSANQIDILEKSIQNIQVLINELKTLCEKENENV